MRAHTDSNSCAPQPGPALDVDARLNVALYRAVDSPQVKEQRPLLRRDRLLQELGQRFGLRVIVVHASAGFGKSTLLQQAIAENSLDPRGVDIYIPIPAKRGDALDLATMVMSRLLVDRPAGDAATIEHVVDAVWARAPYDVALIIDDLHRVQERSDIAADLQRLIDELPANGHVVIASRQLPPIPLQAMIARGEVLVLDEADLRFNHDELASFASLRDSTVADLGSDGWPALAELRATSGATADKSFVAEEVLAAIGTGQLEALRRLVLHGQFDDDLVARCTSYTGQAADLAAQLPLTRFDGESYLLHDMWPSMLPTLTPSEEADACVELAAALEDRGDLVSAIQLLVKAEQWPDVHRILLTLARDFAAHYDLSERRRALATLPETLRETAAAKIVAADLLFLPSPPTARYALEDAAEAALAEEDHELEALALFRLAELAFRAAEVDKLQRHLNRLVELSRDSSAISSLARLVRVWQCMSSDRPEEALSFLAVESSDYAPTRAYEDFYRASLLYHTGHAAATLEGKAEVLARLPGRLQARAAGSHFISLFQAGQMTADELAGVTELVRRIRTTEDTQLFIEGACTTAVFHFAIGEIKVAEQLLADAKQTAVVSEPGGWSTHIVAIAEAAKLVSNNDEAGARELLEATIPAEGPYANLSRHLYLNIMALAYFLVPRSRVHFERGELGAEGVRAVAIGRALAALREDDDPAPAAALDWTRPELLLPWAFEPHLAELAVAAASEGVPEASLVIQGLRHDPYGALSVVANRSKGRVATTANALLKTTPRRPTAITRIEALGPLVITTGRDAPETSLRRRRVVELLALLILNERMTRAEICARLWPDFDKTKARNNLGVTLTYLRRIVDPGTDRGAESWHITTKGESLSLARSEYLEIDCDEFNSALASARRADNAGLPGTALGDYLRVASLYRGELFPSIIDSEVGEIERTRFRLGFVHAATRSANLLTASGRPAEGVDLSRRAIQAEPLSEAAHATFIRALEATGQPTDAAQAECKALFADAGLSVSRDLSLLLERDR